MDYRQSHLEKGAVYDETLEQTPFDAYMSRMERELLPGVIRNIAGGSKIPRYLDFACGTGRITQLVREFTEHSYGVDVSESMLDVARGKCPGTEFIVRDVTSDPLDIAPVNLISSFRFFGNAQDELRVAVLREFNRMLADDGYLVVNNHCNPGALGMVLYKLGGGDHGMDLSHGKFDRLLAEAGFEVERKVGIGAWILLSRMRREGLLNSRFSSAVEPLSRIPGLAPICPDALIVARKVRNLAQ